MFLHLAALPVTASSLTRRSEDNERASEEQVLHHAQVVHGRHAAHLHQLPGIQPSGKRVLQVCQHTGEVLLHQDQRSGAHREVDKVLLLGG